MLKCPVCKNENVFINKRCSICQFSEMNISFINCSDADEWMKNVVIPFRNNWVKDIESSYMIEKSKLVQSNIFKRTETGYCIDGISIDKKQFDNLPIEHCPLFYLKDICTNIVIKYHRKTCEFFELNISPNILTVAHNDLCIKGKSGDSSGTFEVLCDIIFGDYKLHKMGCNNFACENEEIPVDYFYIGFELNSVAVFGARFPTDGILCF